WVDSAIARTLPVEQRAVYFPEDAGADPEELSRRLSRRMAAVGRAPHAKQGKGNPTKKLRFSFAAGVSDERIASVAGWGKIEAQKNDAQRLPAANLSQVGADHIWHAVERLLSGEIEHPFGESTDYDVILDDGQRLPPKAVFGLAASDALGFEVRPQHFKGGLDTPCFRIITKSGYHIAPKGKDFHHSSLPTEPEERSWAEGNKKLRSHIQRERSSGLSRAKKQAFKREHGRLHCEKCMVAPEDTYGERIGEACIEVHHILPLGQDHAPRRTRLEDLICVCANCHRVIHYELRTKK
ncbi:MAG: hypothetical protein OXI66_18760, partial [Boseongicola sp.]|nr:hypothetical protein [Boseongicola sp.]